MNENKKNLELLKIFLFINKYILYVYLFIINKALILLSISLIITFHLIGIELL